MDEAVDDRWGWFLRFAAESIVEMTTLVDLTRQLSNLREVILHLSEEPERLR
jgi:hypothetical protein